MKVVLLDDIIKLGEAGTICDVKDGYARNYLIPQRLAEKATADAINRINLIQRAAEVKRNLRMEEAAGKFAALEGKTLGIQMKAGTESRLFGAVTSAMIADEIQIQFSVTIDRRHIMLEEPIKHLGEFTVPLRAAADVTGEIKLVVASEFEREAFEKALVDKALAEDQAAEEAAAAAAEAAGEGEAEVVADPTAAATDEAASEADVQEKYEADEEQADA